ncbi:transposase [Arcicella aquatica]|uniref:Transposase n=1 Tax=Arcicella aquatica TaxID=217141 RepID=A0ABU5QSZ0_9BACT|nr:transposase [Arcicella aquatica]MEA5259934.1 transposase [Arcicella aquatica]
MNAPQIRNSHMEIGEVYFYTSTILGWKHLLKHDLYKTVIIDSLRNLVERDCIKIYGFVIMPNHIHLLWEMLKKNGKEMPDTSFTKFTAHQFKHDLSKNHPHILEKFKSEKNDRQYHFWQRDALAIRVFSREMFIQKLAYIHLNPLQERWNLANRPENYVWSSAKFYELGEDNYGFITHFMDRF